MRRALVTVWVMAMWALAGCAAPHEALVGATWTDAEGDTLPDSTINVIRGPSHCGWQSSVWLHVTLPTDDPAETRQYIRDPSDVVPAEFETILDTDVELPDGASPTGYRAGGVELWLGLDGGDDAVYVAFDDDHVERWPRSAEGIACD